MRVFNLLYFFVILNIFKYIENFLQLRELNQIKEEEKDDIVLFTEYEEYSFLGVSKSNIYIITSKEIKTIQYINNYNLIKHSTNLINIDNDSFALICLENIFIVIFDIKTGTEIKNYPYNKQITIGNQCGMIYKNDNFYIGFPSNETSLFQTGIYHKYFIISKDLNDIKNVNAEIYCKDISNSSILIFNQNEFLIISMFCPYDKYPSQFSITNISSLKNHKYYEIPFKNFKLKGVFQIDDNYHFLYGHLYNESNNEYNIIYFKFNIKYYYSYDINIEYQTININKLIGNTFLE